VVDCSEAQASEKAQEKDKAASKLRGTKRIQARPQTEEKMPAKRAIDKRKKDYLLRSTQKDEGLGAKTEKSSYIRTSA